MCEFANISNISNGEKYDESQPRKLTNLFHNNNKLDGDELAKVMSYSSLHLFMLKYEVGNKMSMDKLLTLSHEDLIALFFLGDQQKHDLILKQLRALYE